VLVLHFSGTWGSGGLYDIASHPRDASAAIDFALSPNAPAQIDARNIVVIGYSFGSRAALFTAYQDPRVTAVISIGGFADFSEVMFDRSFYESVSPFLNGTTPDSLIAQLNTLGGGLQPYEVVEQLTVPTLIVHGDADEVVPFYNALALAGKRADVAVVEGANHVFGDHRPQLIAAVTEFMAEITP
jgi:pimeloyl-ACP methyl ester carboxylesterase